MADDRKRATTVLSSFEDDSKRRGKAAGADGRLTSRQRQKLGELEYVNMEPLVDQISKRYEVFHAVKAVSELPALSEQEIVQRVLYLAAPRATDEQRALAMVNCADFRLLSHGWKSADVFFATKQPALGAIYHWWDSIAQIRADFGRAVALAKADPDAARKKVSRWIGAALDQITPVPRIIWKGHRAQTELRLYSRSSAAACGYALMLLLDEDRSLLEWLRFCKHESCSRPFLGLPAPGGSPPSAYCSEECKTNAKRELTAQRVARWRNRQAKGAK